MYYFALTRRAGGFQLQCLIAFLGPQTLGAHKMLVSDVSLQEFLKLYEALGNYSAHPHCFLCKLVHI